MSISVLAGLGNPGEEYAGTRHNLGWQVLDAFAAKAALTWVRDRHAEALLARWPGAAGNPVILAKPLTFMNDSGRGLRRLCDYYRIRVDQVAVVYDDLTLDVGRIKLSVSGSAGGHNGLQSLLDHLGDGFVRYRIGIGPRQPPQIDLKDFVLGKFAPTDQLLIDNQISQYIQGLELLLARGVETAMNQLNRRSPSANDPDQAQI